MLMKGQNAENFLLDSNAALQRRILQEYSHTADCGAACDGAATHRITEMRTEASIVFLDATYVCAPVSGVLSGCQQATMQDIRRSCREDTAVQAWAVGCKHC